MPDIAHSAHEMTSGMTPVLGEGEFVFATTNNPTIAAQLMPQAKCVFGKAEGTSFILPLKVASEAGFDVAGAMHCITHNVYSSLDGVGLTAAVATALAQYDIPFNMVAAFHHDHVFVPADVSAKALDILHALQDSHSTDQ